MANLYVIVEPATDLKKSVDALMVSVSNIKRSTESVGSFDFECQGVSRG